MNFLKKNYEKILLAVVVLAALGVVAFLPIVVSQQKEKLTNLEAVKIRTNNTPEAPVNLAADDAMVKRPETSVNLNLAGPHKVFNPVRWQMKPGGTIIPNPAGKEVEQLQLTKTSPLYEIYSLVTVSVTAGLPTHYGIGIAHETGATPSQRLPKTTYAALNQTTNNFTVVAAEGPEEAPDNVTLVLSDTRQKVTISKEKPYKRVEGYTADLTYPPENKSFLNRRKSDTSSICFAGECYKIVDIEESQVVLLQQSNQKQWIKELNPKNSTAPAP
jgi:hypothetical protein